MTIRSTNPGKLSSSQDFSIGRSISLTRSSSVRALLLSTVLARELKADSTAETVERDKIAGPGGELSNGGSWTGCLALRASLNSMASAGSILLNEAAGGADVVEVVAYRTVLGAADRDGDPDIYRMLLDRLGLIGQYGSDLASM